MRAAEQTRVCGRCLIERKRDEYSPSAWTKTGGNFWCRPCRKEVQRGQRLQYRYGLTEQAYDAMFVGQGGVCALCKKCPELPTDRPPLVVDHDHATGVVRGLLCDSCNSALGKLGDNEDGLLAALAYVRGTWR